MRLLLAAVLACVAARAEHLVFTTVAPLTCPIVVSAPVESKDFGYQSVLIRNDADLPVQAIYFSVTFALAAGNAREETVDSGHVYVAIEPGEEKRTDVFLGRVTAMLQKLKSAGQPVAWIRLLVDSVEFEDGTHWDHSGPRFDTPRDPGLSPK